MSENEQFDFKKELKKSWYVIIVIAVMFALSIAVYSDLPPRMPIHFSLDGKIDSYTSRFWGAFMLPLISTGILLLMLISPRIDPRKDNYEKFGSTYRIIRTLIVLFFAVLHFIIISTSLGYNLDIGKIMVVVLGLLFILMGNYIPRVRHNYFLGIKTPWSLANEKVWRKTQRFTGKLFVLSGIVMLVSIFFSDTIRFAVTIIGILGSIAAGFVYSYIIFQNEEKDK